MKRLVTKTLAPISAVVAVLALAVSGVQAQTTPVLEYNFPASWDGTGTAVTDQSPAGNNGNTIGVLALSAAVPPGAAIGTQSINTSAGGILTSASGLLDNSLVATAGGFRYDVAFMWDGTDTSGSFGGAEKIVDYAGYESLQLNVTGAGVADLVMRFDDSVNAVSTAILPDTWYTVSVVFDTQGNAVDTGDGSLDGLVSMVVNGGAPITAAATKTSQGDDSGRPIGIGQLGADFGYLVGFKGDIYNPSVTLVPEPSTIALGLMGGLAFLGVSARRRFKK